MFLKSKALLLRHAHNNHWRILFVAEKIVDSEESISRQNDHVYQGAKPIYPYDSACHTLGVVKVSVRGWLVTRSSPVPLTTHRVWGDPR
ncbi:hypothetical protein TNCV_455121 [Trichonephila clavipes]|nr:hypothetical protein TNCV_455121 [Trichonephila clavipes]